MNTSNSANPRTTPFLVATIGVLSEPPVASATLLSTQMLAAERISASAAKTAARRSPSVRLSPKEPPGQKASHLSWSQSETDPALTHCRRGRRGHDLASLRNLGLLAKRMN